MCLWCSASASSACFAWLASSSKSTSARTAWWSHWSRLIIESVALGGLDPDLLMRSDPSPNLFLTSPIAAPKGATLQRPSIEGLLRGVLRPFWRTRRFGKVRNSCRCCASVAFVAPRRFPDSACCALCSLSCAFSRNRAQHQECCASVALVAPRRFPGIRHFVSAIQIQSSRMPMNPSPESVERARRAVRGMRSCLPSRPPQTVP